MTSVPRAVPIASLIVYSLAVVIPAQQPLSTQRVAVYDENAMAVAQEIALWAAQAPVVAGLWRVEASTTAAGGFRIRHPNAGAVRPSAPLAAPANYFELTFPADANVPYHLWLRGRADSNSWANDSVWVQFSNVDAYPIGTTKAATVTLEDCTSCGVSGWGWQDNGFGLNVLGPHITFTTSGQQTIRIQTREDGLSIDQIVLSPSTWLTRSPGALKNDTTILAPSSPPPPTSSVTLVRGPYLQQLGADGVVIVWATREGGAADVRVGGRTVAAASRYFSAASTGLGYDYYQHEGSVRGLSAGLTYSYEARVNGLVAASGHSFSTAPGPAGAVKFIAFGDSGIGSTAQKTLASRMTADAWNIALHTGDIVYGSATTSGDASYATYQSWFFDIYKGWLPGRGFFPSIGNHDARATNNHGEAYLNLFTLPEEAGASAYPEHAERYYSFDYGPVHFVALDTELAFQDPSRRQVQLAWLEADLQSTARPWKIVYFHRSPYSAKGEHGSDRTVRQAFAPVFERNGVQLALSAHDHMYERSVPWREFGGAQAVTYVVTGGGGARLYPAGLAPWTVRSRSIYHYTRVRVSGCTLFLEAVGTDGGVFDRFTLDRCAQASDAAPPTVRVTAPLNGATVSGIVTVSATASDDVRVEKVDFWVDGVLKALDRTSSYSFAWDSRTVPAGSHTLEARAYDLAGNRVRSAKVTVTSTGS